MLLSMLREKGAKISLKDGRIFLQCKDSIVIMDVPIDSVCKYVMKKTKVDISQKKNNGNFSLEILSMKK